MTPGYQLIVTCRGLAAACVEDEACASGLGNASSGYYLQLDMREETVTVRREFGSGSSVVAETTGVQLLLSACDPEGWVHKNLHPLIANEYPDGYDIWLIHISEKDGEIYVKAIEYEESPL